MASADTWVLFSQLVLLLIVAFVTIVVITFLSLLIYWKTNRVLVPRILVFSMGLVESPLRMLMRLFRIDDKKLDYAIISIRNNLYRPTFAKVPYAKRAIFIPQCLRSPECPAKLSPEGIQCINCGRCGLGEIKKFCESLGCMFFITASSTFIQRMVLKYKPEAILGVGCSTELREGSDMVARIGLPAQGILLKRSGCVDTRVDLEKLMNTIALSEVETGLTDSIHSAISDIKDNITNMWKPDECPKEGVDVKTEFVKHVKIDKRKKSNA